MPMALMCSAMLFTPPMLGLQTAYAAEQQQGSISGTVVDSQGEPIIGASVIIVGGQTVQGTVTDFDGNFTLKVKPGTQLKSYDAAGRRNRGLRCAEEGHRDRCFVIGQS